MPLVKQPAPASLLDLAEDEAEVDWIIVFEESDDERWWEKWLKPGFKHVSAIRWDGFNWIYVTDLLGYTRVEVLPWTIFERPEHNWKRNKETDPVFLHVKRRVKPKELRKSSIVGLNTCVECIKNLLGIDRFFLFTPYQLYKHLMRERGECVSTHELSWIQTLTSRLLSIMTTPVRWLMPAVAVVDLPKNSVNSSGVKSNNSTSSNAEKKQPAPQSPADAEDAPP